ncbi:MAG: type II toxin-antitoxin system RelE/ParE family toxin [Synergistaceae bacterium]|nr:type II toxin-antitoxin system RelE/ParE family toxin [Synergistaceae bacterium]MBQ9596097.1 type II toxin-antitoxin system RelE/ParE family toxin [Synergistaceae bacterium]
MNWTLEFLTEARDDLHKLDGSQRQKVFKAIDKALKNPLARSQGGYGIELGNKGGVNLTNCLEIKLRGEGLRAIYKLIHTKTEMLVIIVGVREDEKVYNEADARIKLHRL